MGWQPMTPFRRLAITFAFSAIAPHPTYSLMPSLGTGNCNHKVLVVLSSADHLHMKNGKNMPHQGNFFNEVVVPAEALKDAGFELVFANPMGNAPSFMGEDLMFFRNDKEKFEKLKNYAYNPEMGGPTPAAMKNLASVADTLYQFDAVFIPGGNSVLQDLTHDADLSRILTYFHETRKMTAVICNAASTLLSTQVNPWYPEKKQKWLYEDYKMTVFSDPEWALMQPALIGGLKFGTPETMLKYNKAWIEQGPPATSHVIEDRELLSGQNPFSVDELTTRMIDKLQKQCGN